MASNRRSLSGGRGWSAVVGLSTVLAVLVVGQLPAASSTDPSPSPVATALGVLVPSLAPSLEPTLQPTAAVPELGPAEPAATEPSATGPSAPVDGERTVTTSAADRLPGPFRPAALRAPEPPAAAAPTQPVVQPAAKPVAKPAAAQPAAGQPVAGLCSGPGWQQRRGQAALATLKGGAPRTGFRVEFKGARKGYMGLTHLNERRIEMFVRDCGTQSDELLRHVMAHELGHAYDTTHNSAAVRQSWMKARGIRATTPWYGCSGCSDFATPAGDYAEVYAQWARGASTNRSKLAGDVPPAQLAALARQFFGA